MANYIVNGKMRYHNFDPENSPHGYPGQEQDLLKQKKEKNVFIRFWNWIKKACKATGEFLSKPFKKKKRKMTPSEIIESITLQMPNKEYSDNDTKIFDATFWRPRGMNDVEFIYTLEGQSEEDFKKMNKDVRQFICYMKSIDGVYYPHEMEYYYKINEILNDPEKMSGLGKIINRLCICAGTIEKEERQEYESLLTKVFLAFNVTQDLMKVNTDPTFQSSYNNFINLNNINIDAMNGQQFVHNNGQIVEINVKK